MYIHTHTHTHLSVCVIHKLGILGKLEFPSLRARDFKIKNHGRIQKK